MDLLVEYINNLRYLVDKYKSDLDEDTIDSVNHYILHDEYGMAYEGLFIELINIRFNPNDIDIPLFITIGKYLKLDQQSIFDASFWSKLINYLNRGYKSPNTLRPIQ